MNAMTKFNTIIFLFVRSIKRWLGCAIILIVMCCAARQEETSSILKNNSITPPNENMKTYSYLALGDSYTIGESVNENQRWCVQLAAMVNNEKGKIESPDIIARTGWTTSELISAINKTNNTTTYDIVSLLIGVNNQYRGESIEVYQKEFSELLRIAIRYANGNSKHVFVLSIPDWGVTPFASGSDRERIANEIDAFNTVAKEACAKYDIRFIDITPISRKALNNPIYMANDNLHFSGAMYTLWADAAYKEVSTILD